jgi:hypothetical protein
MFRLKKFYKILSPLNINSYTLSETFYYGAEETVAVNITRMQVWCKNNLCKG